MNTEPLSAQEVFASRLVAARKSVGLSQVDLARKVGVAQSTLSKWEQGDSDLQAVHLRPLAKALGLTLEDVTPGGSVTEYEGENESRVGLALIQRVSKVVADGRLSAANALLMINLLDALAS